MKKIYLSLLYFLVILTLAACQSKWRQPFPDGEIVYQTGLYSQNKLGFTNSDGSSVTIITVGGYLRKPVWSSDGSIIYGLAKGLSYSYGNGYPAYWENDEGLKTCGNWGYMDQIEATGNDAHKEVLTSDGRAIWWVNLENCKRVIVVVNYPDASDLSIRGFSYDPATQDLVFGLMRTEFPSGEESAKIIKKNIGTGMIDELAEGCNPNWSPDGAQIAYLAKDGLYVMKADGTQAHLILKHNFYRAINNTYGVVSPVPRWSPDGKWIIFHRCEEYDCFVLDNSIYKLNLVDGEEVKIADGGGFPSWKP
jgi:hypothetical protein